MWASLEYEPYYLGSVLGPGFWKLPRACQAPGNPGRRGAETGKVPLLVVWLMVQILDKLGMLAGLVYGSFPQSGGPTTDPKHYVVARGPILRAPRKRTLNLQKQSHSRVNAGLPIIDCQDGCYVKPSLVKLRVMRELREERCQDPMELDNPELRNSLSIMWLYL